MKFAILIYLFLYIGCTTTPPIKKASKISSINGEGKATDIQNDLIRASHANIFSEPYDYSAEGFPYTKALITSTGKELCEKNKDSQEVCSKKIKNELILMFDTNSCFMLTLNAKYIEMASSEMWKFKVEQPAGKYIESNSSNFNKIPNINHNNARKWYNNGIVCFKNKINYTEGFKLYLIPQFGGSDAKELILEWLAP